MEPDSPLFASETTKGHLRGDHVSDVVRKWTRRAVGRTLSAHSLRRTFAVHAASDEGGKQAMPLRQLQRQLGHASGQTTWHYLAMAQGDFVESYRRSVPKF